MNTWLIDVPMLRMLRSSASQVKPCWWNWSGWSGHGWTNLSLNCPTPFSRNMHAEHKTLPSSHWLDLLQNASTEPENAFTILQYSYKFTTSLSIAQCTREIRLVGGSSEREGRLEVCLNQGWGRVCDEGWSPNELQVVCKQLGYSASGKHMNSVQKT